jgi:hypothetical protein
MYTLQAGRLLSGFFSSLNSHSRNPFSYCEHETKKEKRKTFEQPISDENRQESGRDYVEDTLYHHHSLSRAVQKAFAQSRTLIASFS